MSLLYIRGGGGTVGSKVFDYQALVVPPNTPFHTIEVSVRGTTPTAIRGNDFPIQGVTQ